MATLKTTVRRRTSYIITHEEHEFELRHEPVDHIDPIVKQLPTGGWVVGYLSQDTCAENPLTDCDGIGHIYDGRRGSCREERNKYREAVGLNDSGDCYEDFVRDPLVVLLDVYSHSGEVWRIHGGGRSFPDEQWDVSNCAGVWVPDPCCVEHIQLTAAKKLWDVDITIGCSKTKIHGAMQYRQFCYYMRGKKKSGRFVSVQSAIRSALKHQGLKFDKDQFTVAMREEAFVCAGQAIETYNSWLAGDVYGVCYSLFDTDGVSIDSEEDSCWGFIGSDYAERELKSGIANYCKTSLPATETEVQHGEETSQ
jgi:hypothetical protein